MSTDIRLVDFGVHALHETRHEVFWQIAVVKSLKIQAHIDTRDVVELVTIIYDKIMHHRRGTGEITNAVNETQMRHVGRNDFRFRGTSYLHEWQVVITLYRKHLTPHFGTIITLRNYESASAEELRISGTRQRFQYGDLQPIQIDTPCISLSIVVHE